MSVRLGHLGLVTASLDVRVSVSGRLGAFAQRVTTRQLLAQRHACARSECHTIATAGRRRMQTIVRTSGVGVRANLFDGERGDYELFGVGLIGHGAARIVVVGGRATLRRQLAHHPLADDAIVKSVGYVEHVVDAKTELVGRARGEVEVGSHVKRVTAERIKRERVILVRRVSDDHFDEGLYVEYVLHGVFARQIRVVATVDTDYLVSNLKAGSLGRAVVLHVAYENAHFVAAGQSDADAVFACEHGRAIVEDDVFATKRKIKKEVSQLRQFGYSFWGCISSQHVSDFELKIGCQSKLPPVRFATSTDLLVSIFSECSFKIRVRSFEWRVNSYICVNVKEFL